MKSTLLHQRARLLLAVGIACATLLSPDVAQSADERLSSFGQDDSIKLALADTHNYFLDASALQARVATESMTARWQQVQQTLRPDRLLKASEAFQQDFPGSQHAEASRTLQDGAGKALRAVREAKLSLGAVEEISGDAAYRTDLTLALRGDKDAAHRVAMMYDQGSHGLPHNPRRAEQWLHVAAELGNAVASWQVAQIYNRDGQVADAAKYETKAIAAGYDLPARLPTRGRNY